MTKPISKTVAGIAIALAGVGSAATAGGLDRSGQSVDILFESGNYGELSFGSISPSVSGTDPILNPTGDMAPSYTIAGLGVKVDISDRFAVALVYDQPFGASAAYPAGSMYAGVSATVQSNALTALASYDVSDRIVVFGGASMQSTSAEAAMPLVGGYTLDMATASGVGYVAGAAFQIPDIALRVALTYRSAITSTHDTVEFGAIPGTLSVTTPQSANLEFQTGINPKTLVFGSVRWVNWSAFSVAPTNYPLNPLVSYASDSVTYSLGVGRKLTDSLSGAVTVGYEAASGGVPSALAPTDGNISVGVGVTYTMGDAKITGGVRYIWLGDAAHPAVGTFAGNTAIAAGISVGFDF